MPDARSFSGEFAAADLTGLFRHQLEACRLAEGEECLCITDTAWNPAIAAACLTAALSLGANAHVLTFPASRAITERALASALAGADLIIYMSGFTLHYRPEVRAALARGARVLCVMQPVHVLQRLNADADVRRRAMAGAERLSAARRIKITSQAGTDLTMDKSGRPGLAAYGFADQPGHLDFWGGGMVQAAQIEGTTEGRLVLDVGDVCFMLARFVESPVEILFERGRVTAINGGLDAKLIRHCLDAAGDEGATLAGHMAWGVDRRARWLAPILDTPDQGGGGADSEAYLGNIQIEIGSNDDVIFGGKNRSAGHMGLCLLGANLWLDGEAIITDGRFVPPDLQ